VHYEAGLGCIDCHGSHDMHGGDPSSANGNRLMSRMEQITAIRCESCHGTIDAYATTVAGTDLRGSPAEVAIDAKGNELAHVVKESDGHYYLTSKLTGARHYVVQVRDSVVDNGRVNGLTQQPLYSAKASYAMGRMDGDPSTGTGPQQTACTNCDQGAFSHTDRMSCIACHASWTNSCVGCHLEGEYDTGANFSNITGERIVFAQRFADFTYQTPVPFQLGVNARDEITQVSPNTKVFFTWHDRNGDQSLTFSFSDRKAAGKNPARPARALSHNAIMAHSIRGRVTQSAEGPRYCVACHLTTDGLAAYGLTDYQTFIADMAAGAYDNLDFAELQSHIGLNPGNQLDSPLWVHMVAGLGSGLFLFDENGCPVNPLDGDPERKGCDGVAPNSVPFSSSRVALDLDRIVEWSGGANSSSNHALLFPALGPSLLRAGASNPTMAGPLGGALIRKLADPVNGVLLDSWLDADGQLRGDAALYVR
jgi:hypothetical protein